MHGAGLCRPRGKHGKYMKSRIISTEELRQFKRQELADSIDSGVSLLRSIGADPLLKEMRGSGFLCRLLAFSIFAGAKDKASLRSRAVRILKRIAPYEADGTLPPFEGCVVIGFNHPSLGEIFRLLTLGFLCYPDRDFLFPVNIPWYETLVPVIPKLNKMGIYITPMITPKTEGKLLAMLTDEQLRADVSKYKTGLEKLYMKRSREMSENNAVIVLAPSATRQKGVFPSEEARQGKGHIHPTMTLLAHRICTEENSPVIFVPVRVFEPQPGNTMFNLYKSYRLAVCREFSSGEIFGMTDGHNRDFDFRFLKRLDEAE